MSTEASAYALRRRISDDFEEAWKRYLPSEKPATVATVATRDRGNVAAVADVAASAYIGDEDEKGLDL